MDKWACFNMFTPTKLIMNMKWVEVGDDHSYYDFDRQKNTSSKASQKNEKEEHHGKNNNLVSHVYNN